MELAKFYVDFCFEAGSDEYGCNLSGRYWFQMELTNDEYEELYQIWYDYNELISWSNIWDGHDALYTKINETARYALNQILAKDAPEFLNPVEVLWELSQETKDAF